MWLKRGLNHLCELPDTVGIAQNVASVVVTIIAVDTVTSSSMPVALRVSCNWLRSAGSDKNNVARRVGDCYLSSYALVETASRGVLKNGLEPELDLGLAHDEEPSRLLQRSG